MKTLMWCTIFKAHTAVDRQTKKNYRPMIFYIVRNVDVKKTLHRTRFQSQTWSPQFDLFFLSQIFINNKVLDLGTLILPISLYVTVSDLRCPLNYNVLFLDLYLHSVKFVFCVKRCLFTLMDLKFESQPWME